MVEILRLAGLRREELVEPIHLSVRLPPTEYRRPTDEERSDFQEHVDKRKVQLGSCGRPCGTPCAHEHACIRCPMLSIRPKMLPRLDELEADLLARSSTRDRRRLAR